MIGTTTRRWWEEPYDAFLPASLEAGNDGRTNQDDWTRNVAAVSPQTGGEMCTEMRKSPIGSRGRHETWLSETDGCHETLLRNLIRAATSAPALRIVCIH